MNVGSSERNQIMFSYRTLNDVLFKNLHKFTVRGMSTKFQ